MTHIRSDSGRGSRYSPLATIYREVRAKCEQSRMQYPLEWKRMQNSLPYTTFEHVWHSLHTRLKNYQNFYNTLGRGSMSGLRSSYLFLSWPKLPPLSDILHLHFFYSGSSTQTGAVMIYSPRSTHRYNSPNYDSYPVSTFSRYVMLHECRNNCTHL